MKGIFRESLQVLRFWKIAQNHKYRLAARGLPPGTSTIAMLLRGCDERCWGGF